MRKTKTTKILSFAFSVTLAFSVLLIGTILVSAKTKPKLAVHIHHHGVQSIQYVHFGTVRDVLAQADIVLSAFDTLNLDINTEVSDGAKIEINEVRYSTDTKVQKVGFLTEYVKSDDYPIGYEEVIQKGAYGQKRITSVYKNINGKRESVTSVSKKIIKEPQNKIVVQGTFAEKPSVFSKSVNKVETPSVAPALNTINGMAYKKVLTGVATAYTAPKGALTSTGVPAYVGGVAVNPDIIPYGSKLYIVADGYTYGYATAVDTGGALMSGSALVDLYMASYDECINFGRRNVTVYVLS